MAAESIPSWIGDPTTDIDTGSWNKVILGDVILPGIATIEGLHVGLDIETKKAKGSDQWTSKDNGLDKSEFKIKLQIKAADWSEFQATLIKWNPRRPGRTRGPVEIIHPFVNAFEIKTVRLVKTECDSPTAKSGLQITLWCEEWFDKPKETKATNTTARTTTFEEYQAGLAVLREGGTPKDQVLGVKYDPTTGRMNPVPGARLATALKERGVNINNPSDAAKAGLWR